MPFTGDKYVGDLALYYIAKKLESGQKRGSVKNAIDQNNIDAQLKGGDKVNTQTDTVVDDDKIGMGIRTATKFNQQEINTAIEIADRTLGLPQKIVTDDSVSKGKKALAGVTQIEKVVEQFAGPNEITFDFAPNKPIEVVIKDSKGAKDPVYTGVTFDFAPNRDPQDVIAEAKLAVAAGVPASFDVPQTTVEELGFIPGTPTDPVSKPTPGSTPTTSTTTTSTTTTPTTTTTTTTPTTGGSGQIINNAFSSFNNIPQNALYWQVNDNFYIVYEVPGSKGELYEGNPVYLAYELVENDLYKAGLLTTGEGLPSVNATMDQEFFDAIAIVTGNTDQLSAVIDSPFASFVETVGEQSQVAPWITDPEMIALIAEAAVEGREVSDAEWQSTEWYQTHNEGERQWLRTYYADPSTASQLEIDAQIAVGNSLQAAGVSNAPESLVNWLANKYVTGQWSQSYTSEQINLYSDPYATGKRDSTFENFLSSTAITGVDRTTERERQVQELYLTYLGPSLGKLTDDETAEIAGKLRNDPDFEDSLIQSLKQSRLAAFSNYTNPDLTYEDIARPWRNLTTSVWGKTADETQGWWQDMLKSNDFTKAQETLREKGLELDITQVTQDATKALQQALGQGNISQSGVNV
tara:strand:+ start:349 stop:2253 length:1905 start_codon:yes stop_codon:yes gene_type:complete